MRAKSPAGGGRIYFAERRGAPSSTGGKQTESTNRTHTSKPEAFVRIVYPHVSRKKEKRYPRSRGTTPPGRAGRRDAKGMQIFLAINKSSCIREGVPSSLSLNEKNLYKGGGRKIGGKARNPSLSSLVGEVSLLSGREFLFLKEKKNSKKVKKVGIVTEREIHS